VVGVKELIQGFELNFERYASKEERCRMLRRNLICLEDFSEICRHTDF